MQYMIEVGGPQPRSACLSLREFKGYGRQKFFQFEALRFPCAHWLQGANVLHVRSSGHKNDRSSIEIVQVFDEAGYDPVWPWEMDQGKEERMLFERPLHNALE